MSVGAEPGDLDQAQASPIEHLLSFGEPGKRALFKLLAAECKTALAHLEERVSELAIMAAAVDEDRERLYRLCELAEALGRACDSAQQDTLG